eukprot:37126-Prorocentrum_minimum.AAC.1
MSISPHGGRRRPAVLATLVTLLLSLLTKLPPAAARQVVVCREATPYAFQFETDLFDLEDGTRVSPYHLQRSRYQHSLSVSWLMIPAPLLALMRLVSKLQLIETNFFLPLPQCHTLHERCALHALNMANAPCTMSMFPLTRPHIAPWLMPRVVRGFSSAKTLANLKATSTRYSVQAYRALCKHVQTVTVQVSSRFGQHAFNTQKTSSCDQ